MKLIILPTTATTTHPVSVWDLSCARAWRERYLGTSRIFKSFATRRVIDGLSSIV
jgi:hypothetical protein